MRPHDPRPLPGNPRIGRSLLRAMNAWRYAPLLLLFPIQACFAHTVTVFAFIDGPEIAVEAHFGGGRPVRNGKISVTDPQSGEILREGFTDARGMYRFRPPGEHLATGRGLRLVLDAGEGHRAFWTVPPDELRFLAPVPADFPAAAQPLETQLSATQPSTTQPPPNQMGEGEAVLPVPPSNAGQPSASAISPAPALPHPSWIEWEAMVGRVVDGRLAPIRHSLARLETREPGWREVVGGLGWLAGCLGLATYLHSRRKDRHASAR